MTLKLYVWEDPYQIDYGSSLVFAIADSIENAKLIAMDRRNKDYALEGSYIMARDRVKYRLTALPEPTRIVELPCAEWHAWSE